MKAWLAAGLGALMAGCSANATDGDPNGDDNADEEFTCEPGECAGTYLASYTEVDGNCGAIPDQLVRVDSAADGDCTDDAPPIVRDAGCTVESAVSCSIDMFNGYSVVSVIRQSDENCGLVTGTMTVQFYDGPGVEGCVSTYRLRAERQ